MIPYYKNCKGDFIVDNSDCDHCHYCKLPQTVAPGLIEFDRSSCYFIKQPETKEEIDIAINALSVCDCSAVKYRGKDKQIINKILSSPYIKSTCATEATALDRLKVKFNGVNNS